MTKTGMIGRHIKLFWGYFHFLLLVARKLVFPKYSFIVTLISSIFPRTIFHYTISNQRFIENGKYKH